jgi:nucleoside-diphosphate-sugar epimerase
MNLITGEAVFIGSHLVAALLDEGEEVRMLERPGANRPTPRSYKAASTPSCPSTAARIGLIGTRR